MVQRCREQAICQPRVLRQKRSVQITANGGLDDGAFGAILAVVAGADYCSAEWPDARPQKRPTRMVLEADQRPSLAVQVGFDEHVANVPLWAGHAADVKQTGAGQLLTLDGGVALAQQLIAAADRQQRRAVFDGLADSLAFLTQEIGRDHRLLAILAAAEEDQVCLGRIERVSQGQLLDFELDTPPLRSTPERQHVAAIAIDAHQVRVEVNEPNLPRSHARTRSAAESRASRASPCRSAARTPFRSARPLQAPVRARGAGRFRRGCAPTRRRRT